jgi:sporulation protein YlmC with PRC-barrel domain
MTQNVSSSTSTPGASTATTADSPLISSDRVEGTKVYDPSGKDIGTIKRLMIDKVSGRVAYVLIGFGGFLGIGQEEYAIPWDKLDYDPNLGGYRTDVTQDQLKNAPSFYRDRDRSTAASTGGANGGSNLNDYQWNDRSREQELHDYYAVAYYWEED